MTIELNGETLKLLAEIAPVSSFYNTFRVYTTAAPQERFCIVRHLSYGASVKAWWGTRAEIEQWMKVAAILLADL